MFTTDIKTNIKVIANNKYIKEITMKHPIELPEFYDPRRPLTALEYIRQKETSKYIRSEYIWQSISMFLAAIVLLFILLIGA